MGLHGARQRPEREGDGGEVRHLELTPGLLLSHEPADEIPESMKGTTTQHTRKGTLLIEMGEATLRRRGGGREVRCLGAGAPVSGDEQSAGLDEGGAVELRP